MAFRLRRTCIRNIARAPAIFSTTWRCAATTFASCRSSLRAWGSLRSGRTESHVISALHNVMDVLAQLAGTDGPPQESKKPQVASKEGQKLLEKNTVALLGAAPEGRRRAHHGHHAVRGRRDYELVRDLVASGMNCMRINCAHDGPKAWAGMIGNLRRAEQGNRKTLQGLHGRGWS